MIIATPILFQSSFMVLWVFRMAIVRFNISTIYLIFLSSMNFKIKDFYLPLLIIPVTFVNFFFK